MSLNSHTIEQINHLANSVGAMIHVTGSDATTRQILRQIEQLAAGPVEAKPSRTPIDQRIEEANAKGPRGLFGLLAELAKEAESTVSELDCVAQAMGYKGAGVYLISWE